MANGLGQDSLAYRVTIKVGLSQLLSYFSAALNNALIQISGLHYCGSKSTLLYPCLKELSGSILVYFGQVQN